AAGLPSRGEVAKLDEIFPVAPAAFNDAEKLARFLLGLFDGIDDDPVCAHYGLVIDLTAEQHVAARGIDMLSWLHPLATDQWFAAARDGRHNLAGAHGLLRRIRRQEPRFDVPLQFCAERFAAAIMCKVPEGRRSRVRGLVNARPVACWRNAWSSA